MKMLLTGLMLCWGALLHAQTPPELSCEAYVRSVSLGISFDQTTVVLFPAPVLDIDRGQRDVIVSRQAGVDNIIKIKASRKGILPTSLHVYTTDGRLYAFNISYEEQPEAVTFDLSKLPKDSIGLLGTGNLIMRDLSVSTPKLPEYLYHIRNTPGFLNLRTAKFSMRLQLRSVYYDKELLYLYYRLHNDSNIPYQIDFSRMFITDGRKVKRSTSQQQEVLPLFSTPEKQISGNSSLDLVFVVKRFTIPDAKKFKLEVFEKGGGRHISLHLKNKHLFRAHPLP